MSFEREEESSNRGSYTDAQVITFQLDNDDNVSDGTKKQVL